MLPRQPDHSNSGLCPCWSEDQVRWLVMNREEAIK